MNLTRRRFLTVSAAFAAAPAVLHAETWRGRAFGAEVSLTLRAPRDIAATALQGARALILETERLFSLYDPTSALSQLNATGTLAPSAAFHALMQLADKMHWATDGLFDPTVQPLWRALAEGRDPTAARDKIGWHRVTFDANQITLAPGQALTFNGIAQGFATDRITDLLKSHGLSDMLVNIGEHRATGGPFRLAVADPTHGQLATRTLHTGAIATSSPAAMPLGESGHILHKSARPLWSTVSVEAETATQADALSTALTLATRDQIEAIRPLKGIRRITLVGPDGDLTSL